MATRLYSYAWVKLVRTDAPHPKKPPCVLSANLAPCAKLPRDVEINSEIRSGHRPPTEAAALKKADGSYPVEECCDRRTRTKRLRAAAHVHGRWRIDDVFGGNLGATSSFRLVQFVGISDEAARDEAVDWLETRAGQAWLSDADNYFLLEFGFPGAFHAASAGASDTDVQLEAEAPSTCDKYVETDWRDDFLDFADFDVKKTLLPGNWRSQLPIADRALITDEDCKQVAKLVTERGEERRKAILFQAEDIKAMYYVLKGDQDPNGKLTIPTMRLLHSLLKNLRGPIFSLKKEFHRGRPSACSIGIKPALDPSDDLFPAHAAYPAGHATLAYAVAYVFGEIVPDQAQEFTRRATLVAENRIVAGFHFPADNAAGVDLAQQLVRLLKQNQKFLDLMSDITLPL
jgi:hypothetical protein